MSNRDFTIDNHGTIFMLIPHTDAAREWIANSIQEDSLRFGGGVVVEHRYIVDIAHALREEGFGVNN